MQGITCSEDSDGVVLGLKALEVRLTVPEAVQVLRLLSNCAIVRRDEAALSVRQQIALRSKLNEAVDALNACVDKLKGD